MLTKKDVFGKTAPTASATNRIKSLVTKQTPSSLDRIGMRDRHRTLVGEAFGKDWQRQFVAKQRASHIRSNISPKRAI